MTSEFVFVNFSKGSGAVGEKNKMATGSDHGLKRIVWKSKFTPTGEYFLLLKNSTTAFV